MRPDFGEPLNESQMEACAVMVMRMMLEDCSDRGEGAFPELLADFAASRTYGMLFDYETRLWAEGPDYLRAVWERERGRKGE